MRVGMIRQDLARIYVDDVESSSQQCFSSAPAGQSRYLEYPSNALLTSVLNEYAYLSILGSVAGPYTITAATNDVFSIKTSSTAGYTSITVPAAGAPGTSYTAAQLVTVFNAAFATKGLLCIASVQGNHIQIDTIAPSSPYVPSYAAVYAGVPQPSIGLSTEYSTVTPINSGPTAYLSINTNVISTINATIGINNNAAVQTITGLPVSVNNIATATTSLKSAVYAYTAIAGQTGTVAGIASVTSGLATVTGLTGMTANSVLHALTLSNGGGGGTPNDGTFPIVQYVSPTSVVIANANAVAPATNGQNVHWIEKTISFNIAHATIAALSTFASMEGYNAALASCTGSYLALLNAIQGAIAPGLVETGPVLLSFAKGKLGVLSSATFQPGHPSTSSELRLGYPMGPAVYITTDDGSTPFTI